ncbi:glycosyltransferase [Aquiflexum sp. TKW24L]|uniref:glycosyltransferase family 2 protein n=1 Tax=Aquiflexum sp. TKW24L TaxID=2942212 RepID=UPI0020C127E2|nr:glycosyltransferase family 2 protein [Aquiflexum sp. TKW24L]MCL6260684.1 glycosyltransferase [Aquiflexum sp. TKW24L]
MELKTKINLYIPTLNAGSLWPAVLEGIISQTVEIEKKIIIDSGSTDDTLSSPYIREFEILKVDKNDFDHGGTRQLAVETFPNADFYVFLTQDAILAHPDAIANLVKHFESNPALGMVYGRQLPHKGAKELEAHARIFNYPSTSQTRGMEDATKYGIKTISCSNSFAAYRRTAFEVAGGFPSGSILGEDVIIAGQMLLKGWRKGYIADAQVYHSHDYSLKEEFKRYFDIGVFHADNKWIFDHFGRAESEGMKYLKSEISYLLKHNWLLLPKSGCSLLAKWLGYKAGLLHDQIPLHFNQSFSMHRRFWNPSK